MVSIECSDLRSLVKLSESSYVVKVRGISGRT